MAIAIAILALLLFIFFLQFTNFKQSTICIVSTTATLEDSLGIAQLSTAINKLPDTCKERTILFAAQPLVPTTLFNIAEKDEPIKKSLSHAIQKIGLKITPLPIAQTTVGFDRLQNFYKELNLLPIAANIAPFANSIRIVKQGISISALAVIADENTQYIPHSKDITLRPAIEALGDESLSTGDFTVTLVTGDMERTLSALGLEKRDLLLAFVQNRANTMIIFDRDSLSLDPKLLGRFTLYHEQSTPEISVTQIDFIQKESGKIISLFHPTTTTKLSTFNPDEEILSSLKQISLLEKKRDSAQIIVKRNASFDLWEGGETEMERLLHDALRLSLSQKKSSPLTLIRTKRGETSLAKGSKRTKRSIEQIYKKDDYPLLVELSPKALREILQMNTENERFSLSPIRYHYRNGELFLPRSVRRKNIPLLMSSSLYRDIAEKMDAFPQPQKIYPEKIKESLIKIIQTKNPYKFYPRWKIIKEKKDG